MLEELLTVTRMPHLEVEGMFTHFPVADSPGPGGRGLHLGEFRLFQRFVAGMEAAGVRPEICHCCNSGATIAYPEFSMDMVRPGVATYGIAPSQDLAGRLDLRPLLTPANHHFPDPLPILPGCR